MIVGSCASTTASITFVPSTTPAVPSDDDGAGPLTTSAAAPSPPTLQVSVRSGTVCTKAVDTIGDSSQPGIDMAW